jgi:hypothetical protein
VKKIVPFALAALAACASAPAPATGPAPAPGGTTPAQGTGTAAGAQDAATIAAELQRATLPSSPRQANFTWALDESGARFNGRGVARFRAPDRFRLDLFGPRGETYLAAALVDETPRVPAALEQRFRLPSPALLWGALGVVRPPSAARLLDASTSNGVTTVRYDLGGEGTLEYRARGGVLQGVRRLRGGGVQESIDLEHTGSTLRSARYREWNALRTLNLSLESTNDVASFPEDIWSPPGASR